MSRRLSSRVRVLLSLAAALATFALVVPAAASAGQAEWELRSSWVSYVNRWLGSTRAVSPASYGAPLLTLPQVGTGSGNSAFFDGGFRSTIALHGVDVQIGDLTIDYSTGAVTGSGHYKSLGSLSTTPFTNWHLFTLTGGTRTYVTGLKLWEDAIPGLTANGATVFNGGGNGSYAVNDPFGKITAEGDF